MSDSEEIHPDIESDEISETIQPEIEASKSSENNGENNHNESTESNEVAEEDKLQMNENVQEINDENVSDADETAPKINGNEEEKNATTEEQSIAEAVTDQPDDVEPDQKSEISKPKYTYTCTRLRREFGRQCIFGEDARILCQIDPDEELKKQFTRTKTVQLKIENVQQMAISEVSTDNEIMNNFGVYHQEGGWPNDIDQSNDDDKLKYRELNEQAENYCIQMKQLCMRMEHKIAQNNAVNIYEEYFTEEHPQYGRSNNPQIESIGYFECPIKSKTHKIIARHCALSTGGHDKMVIAYAVIVEGQMNTVKSGTSSYIWDLNRNIEPILELKCDASLATVEYNEKDESTIAAGQSDGIISLYDARTGGLPQLKTQAEISHREYVSALRWTMSKGNVEFFTVSNDSFVMWWDIRNMSKPHESYRLDFNTAGCTALDCTFSMPTRFLIGLSNGQIVNGNKRGQTYADRFAYAMKSFSGPVRTVERNPFADKYSMAIGDKSIRFWSDENRETPFFQSREYSDDLTCGAWNRNRCSGFFVGHNNGTVDVWDWLYDFYNPIASINIVNSRVEHLRSHPNGKLLISSHENSDVYLMQISDFLASHKVVDKAKLIEIFDRENSREVLFLTKIREQRMLFNQKEVDDTGDANDDTDSKKLTDEQLIKQCEADFNSIIEKESQRKF